MKKDIFDTSAKTQKGFEKVFEVITNTNAILLPIGDGANEPVNAGDLVYLIKTETKKGKKNATVRLINFWKTPRQFNVYSIPFELLKPYEPKEELNAEGTKIEDIKKIDFNKLKPVGVGVLGGVLGYYCGKKLQQDINLPIYYWIIGFAVGGYFLTNYAMNKNQLKNIEKNVIIN